jgi:hypothetical protein
MERRLACLLRTSVLLGSAFAVLCLGAAGCEPISGPNDPKMTPKEEQKLRERAYTPDQAEERSKRPR